MQTRTFKPGPTYLAKMILIILLIGLAGFTVVALLGWVIAQDEGAYAGRMFLQIGSLVNLAWLVPALILAGPYYRSLVYEIHDDEVIVRVGIWTKSVKHVPYRTVTNITVKRDILDRWFFSLGSLNIQTAGMSGSTGAEEKLVGLRNVQEVYDLVAAELRRFRGAMPPTAAGTESSGESRELLAALLAEVRAIRESKR